MVKTQDLDHRKRDALHRYNALEYFHACNELGIAYEDVEDSDLFDQGKIAHDAELEAMAFLEEGARIQKHRDFLRDVNNSDVIVNRVSHYPETKKQIMVRHYPNLAKGLENYTTVQIGVLFKERVRWAHSQVD